MGATRRRFGGSSAATIRRILAITVAAVGAAALLSGGAVAFDQGAILSPSPSEVEAEPGETVTVSVGLTVSGDHGDGANGVELVAQYDPEYVEITAVERGPWLDAGGADVRQVETLDHSNGVAILDQWRESTETGATGSGELATLTVVVDERAPAGSTSISFAESTIDPAGDWPLPIQNERTATVVVDGDASEVDDGGGSEIDDEDGTQTEHDPTSDAITGVGLTTIVAALIMLIYAALRGRRGG
ncbi:cohesin domain-containing protein [Halobacteria archaeon AArc-dxtr1]|nr:cohesin domain-containing protein [Halobacteria archaeon AArc-dxtr1]